MNTVAIESNEPIHMWFGLTYARYLTLPRSVLQSMPKEWQKQFVTLLEQIPKTLECGDMPDYTVSARKDGKYTTDPYGDYQRGRRVIPAKKLLV